MEHETHPRSRSRHDSTYGQNVRGVHERDSVAPGVKVSDANDDDVGVAEARQRFGGSGLGERYHRRADSLVARARPGAIAEPRRVVRAR